MKKLISILFVMILLIGTGCFNTNNKNEQADTNKLTLYAYDSLTAEWGLLPLITEKFEAENNVEIEIVSFTDTGVMLNQLILEKNEPKADLVMGLDNVNYKDVIDNDLLTAYKPKQSDKLDDSLLFDESFTMTPFDYGYIGFVYDSEQISFDEPISLLDLASAEYKDKIIIEQAGLSSPGTQLMLWSKAALDQPGDHTFKKNLSENVLTVAPDWSTAYYSMFMEGEAPIVLSYLTSPAYHIDQEETEQYKAIKIKEGYIRQVEGIGLVKNSNNAEKAKAFIDYVLEDSVQNQIPTTQWMFPVLGNEDQLPEAYKKIIVPKKDKDEVLSISTIGLINNFDGWLKEWNDAFNI